jgi:hypothetical protein
MALVHESQTSKAVGRRTRTHIRTAYEVGIPSSTIRKVGRRKWKKESGYHRQSRAENTFMRYKLMLGDRLRARDAVAQSVEARLACNILNRMTELGMPASYVVRMWI